MAVVNQLLEDDSNHESGGSTSSIDEFARVNASKEAEIKRVMIGLYEETMWSADQIKDDNNRGSGGSRSSIDELARVSVSTEAEMEQMIRIYKETICPMICADINRKQQNFLSLIRDKFGLDLLTGTTRNFGNTEITPGTQSLQLKFLNGIYATVSTGKNIKGKDYKPILVALVDEISGQIVTTCAIEIEIVVLKGDSNDYEADNWTSDEFNNKIVREWNGKKVLQGNTFVNLEKGTVSLDKISFTHNSSWKGNRKCRLGARCVKSVFPTRVKEAKTESFLVRDKRNLLYNKHTYPSLNDCVYRLKMISNRSECFKRLNKANIKTVMDLLTLNAINPKRLKDIINVTPGIWKVIIDHAQMCKDDRGIYLYYYPRDGQKSNGVVFNISGQLVGLIADFQFVPCEKLPNDKKADAQKLVVSSSENWEKVVQFNNLDSLINHFQSGPTLNSFHNNLNIVIPHTIDTHDHTILTSPQSQSPKRPASEHVISNSPKKPRDHFPMSPSTSGVVTSSLSTPEVIEEFDEYLQYLNLSRFDTWKMMWYVVGWISLISKVRKRRTTFCHDDTVIVIAASMI